MSNPAKYETNAEVLSDAYYSSELVPGRFSKSAADHILGTPMWRHLFFIETAKGWRTNQEVPELWGDPEAVATWLVEDRHITEAAALEMKDAMTSSSLSLQEVFEIEKACVKKAYQLLDNFNVDAIHAANQFVNGFQNETHVEDFRAAAAVPDYSTDSQVVSIMKDVTHVYLLNEHNDAEIKAGFKAALSKLAEICETGVAA